MSEILFHYHKVDPTTWIYLSSLLMIGLFFKFNRFWSVRNLDLVLLILLAPGLLMVNEGRHKEMPAEATAPAVTTAKVPVVPFGPSFIALIDPAAPPAAKAAPVTPRALQYIG